MPIVRIFVSSPGDCDSERQVLDEVVNRVNRSEAARSGIALVLFKWEDEVVPRLGLAPQAVVDQQTPRTSVYLGIMSSRFGGDGTRESGTEVEFRRAVRDFGEKGHPWVLFYFNEFPPPPKSAAEAARLARVFEFREELEKRGIIGTFSGVRGNPKGFFERVEADLRQLLQRPELAAPAPPADGSGQVDVMGSAAMERDQRDGVGQGKASQSRLDIVMSRKRLRCGATNHPPLSDYRYEDDRRAMFSGYYVALARDVAARNGLRLSSFDPMVRVRERRLRHTARRSTGGRYGSFRI